MVSVYLHSSSNFELSLSYTMHLGSSGIGFIEGVKSKDWLKYCVGLNVFDFEKLTVPLNSFELEKRAT